MTLPPDSQPGDALAWAGNQSAHAMIGYGLAMVMPLWLIIAGFALLWEYAYQIRRLGGGLKDSIADTLFVTVGALLIVFPDQKEYIYAGFAAMIAIGVEFRR